jgi:hypothetical protein
MYKINNKYQILGIINKLLNKLLIEIETNGNFDFSLASELGVTFAHLRTLCIKSLITMP